ncbi:MAG: TetR/AcrR family transcriptional regulator, partial [Candidatus Methylomirabilis sp.]|nr:TetR/AcrR family transcriptional regulator [Deltaproteobacteria bacterium]
SSFSPFLNDARGAQSVARERLLGVAETLFAEHGFAGATTQEIARRARVDKRLLFYYFTDKEELRRSVLARFILKMASVQGDPQSWKGDAAENHGRIVNAFVDFAGANPALVKMFLREVLDDGASLKEFYGPIIRRLFADGAKGVEEEHAAGATAYFDPVHFQFCVMGMALFYFLVADAFAAAWGEDPLSPDALDARKKQLLRQILRGVRAR